MSELDVMKQLGMKVVLSKYLGSYQGDAVSLLAEDSRYRRTLDENQKIGFLVLGYGSCSGCDAWESAEDDPLARLELTISAIKGIRWFDSLAEVQAFVRPGPDSSGFGSSGRSYDHALQWYSYEDGWDEFVEEIKALKHGDPLE